MAKAYNVYGSDIKVDYDDTNIEEEFELKALPQLTYGTITNDVGVASGYIDEIGINSFRIHLNIPKGETGISGEDPTFTINNVSTVSSNDQANAELIHESYGECSLNFSIPHGAKGIDGTIVDGYTFSRVLTSPDGTSYLIHEEVDGQTFYTLCLPKGPKGEQGDKKELEFGGITSSDPNYPCDIEIMDNVVYISIPESNKMADGTDGRNGKDGKTPSVDFVSQKADFPNSFYISHITTTYGDEYTYTYTREEDRVYLPFPEPGRDGTNGTDGSDGESVDIDVGDVFTITDSNFLYIDNRHLSSTYEIIDFYLPQCPNGTDGTPTPLIGCDIPTTLVPGSYPTIEWIYRGGYQNLHLGLPRGFDGTETPLLSVGPLTYTKRLSDVDIYFDWISDNSYALSGNFPWVAGEEGDKGESGYSPRPRMYINSISSEETPSIVYTSYQDFLETKVYQVIFNIPKFDGLGCNQQLDGTSIGMNEPETTFLTDSNVADGTLEIQDENYFLSLYIPHGDDGKEFTLESLSNEFIDSDTKSGSANIVNTLAYNGGNFNTVKKVTVSEVFQVPHTGLYRFTIVGGGGGGAAGTNFDNADSVPQGFGSPVGDYGCGGGGGQGGCVKTILRYIPENTEVTIKIGAGGTGGTVPGSSGTAGGYSAISILETEEKAEGGQPGQGIYGGSSEADLDNNTVAGGSGDQGSMNKNTWGLGGKGGLAGRGLGVSGSGRGVANPTNYSGAGGGGGNGASKQQILYGARHQSGRPGAKGQVVIEYFSYI